MAIGIGLTDCPAVWTFFGAKIRTVASLDSAKIS